MTNTVGNVVAGRPKAAGGAYFAPADTTLPTDATTALAAGYLAVGFVGDAGVTESVNRTTQTVKAWGGDTVKVLQTDFEVTYQLTLIEALGANTLKAVNGSANVSSTAKTSSHGTRQSIQVTSDPLPRQVWVFDVQDGDAMVRIVIPVGQIITVGDVTYSDSAVVGYPVTIQAFPDDSGNNVYKYSDDGVKTS